MEGPMQPRPRDLGSIAPGVASARRSGADAPWEQRARPSLNARPLPRPARDTSVLVCGDNAFARRMTATLDGVPGVTIVGYSDGVRLPAGLTRTDWPDVALIEASLGQGLARGAVSPALAGAASHCGVVVIADAETEAAGDQQPIELLRGWSVLLEDSARKPAVLSTVVQGAARGMASIDRGIDQHMISYLSGGFA